MKYLKPSKVDWRDKHFSHAKLFGTTTTFPDSFNVDNGLQVPDQNADNRPSACTSYTVTEMIADAKGWLPSHDYQLMQTFEAMNVPPTTDGADFRTALKVPVAIGCVPADDEPTDLFKQSQSYAANRINWPTSFDQEASQNKEDGYTPIVPMGQDWFDAVRSALLNGNKQSVGVGTQWSPDFEDPMRIHSGILPSNPSNFYWGHAYKIGGWKTIGGSPYLIAKTWQGKNYADGGFCYFPRQLFNQMMKTWGTFAAKLEDIPANTLAECRAQNATLMDVLTAYMKNAYLSLFHGV